MQINQLLARVHVSIARLFFIALIIVPLLQRSVAYAQAPATATYCPDSITIKAPVTDGAVDDLYTLAATVKPETTSTLLQVYWEVTDQAMRMDEGDSSPTQEYAWTRGGAKIIDVTATYPGCRNQTAQTSITISPMPVTEAPSDVYRRAANLLEEQRAVAPEWADASLVDPLAPLAGTVTPLYRPDMATPAYYEFSVYGPTDEGHERGFIIVSTGAHDYPIPNWSTQGRSPTRRMRATAWSAGASACKFFKLDALSYAAEDADGAAVALIGDLPPKVTLPEGWAEAPPPLVTANWVPALGSDLQDPEDGGSPVAETLVVTPTVVGEPVLGDWGTWDALRSGFAAQYQPFLQALAANAAPEWEAENTQAEYGYVLYKGESIAFPLLYESPAPVASGPAWEQGLVDWSIETPAGTAARLVITATEQVVNEGVPMALEVTYAGDRVETIRVIVLGDQRYYAYLPLTRRPEGLDAGAGLASALAAPPDPSSAPQAQAPVATVPAADGYTYWFVGGTQAAADGMQAWYDQYTVSGSCKSGCGPTAWAMLIAWGDMRAHEATNSAWAGRTGLYRVAGGRGDPSAVAPVTLDDGVKNMVEEIRDWVVTFCNTINDSGATQPFSMHRVGNYLNGRSGVNTRTWYLPAGFSLTGSDGDAVRSAARNVIQNEGDWRRPTVIGTGWFSHYPLAYGYREKVVQACTTSYKLVNGKMTWVESCQNILYKGFYVNQGWGDGTGEWVSTDIWFNGRLTPQVAGSNDIGFYRSADDSFHFDTDHDLAGQFFYRYDSATMPFSVRPVVGDFDRDGVLDDLAHYVYAFWDSGKRYDWYLDYDANATIDRTLDRPFAISNGWPLVLDHDRDGFVDDVAAYAPDTYTYGYLCYDDYCQGYGTGGDYRLVVSGDFDRDGDHDDIAFYSTAMRSWAYDLDHDGDYDGSAVDWPAGASVDALPFAGDLDQDGIVDDVGVFDPAYRVWWFDYNHNGTTDASGTGWGQAGDLPFAGNFWQN